MSPASVSDPAIALTGAAPAGASLIALMIAGSSSVSAGVSGARGPN
ncbi:MAG: hypothetical protein ABI024_13575 [Vicinamibacterales bacterium]